MIYRNWLIPIIILTQIVSCKNQTKPQLTDEEVWKLGWRMVESQIVENLQLANIQFDSLLNHVDNMDVNFLSTGLEVKAQLNKKEELTSIVSQQDTEIKKQLCEKAFLATYEICRGIPKEEVKEKNLQFELLGMYLNDQAARGNIMNDIMSKYELDEDQLTQEGGIVVDEKNRSRLKEIFKEYGFPNRNLVGRDAMNGIFIMIQHSDEDREWQKLQLDQIEIAVKNGDMHGQSYAYLYDRIKINGGEKQLYGTQFSNVDLVEQVVTLADTENLEELDKRRRELGMMPVDMYKRLMLTTL